MSLRIIISTIALTFAINISAKENIFDLPPFERAICCIKYYEGLHRAKDYPYVGFGHRLLPGENYSSNMSYAEAETLLRKDLKNLCKMFRCYGKDSLLLATLAYNIGPYKILGNKNIDYCHWNGKKIYSIMRRRAAELVLLYVP